MNTKLSQESPELAALLGGLDETGLQKVALQVAKQAITTTGVDAPLVSQILEQSTVPGANTEITGQLDELADAIEGPYLDALDEDEDVENNPELMKLFRQARAVTSLSFALSDGPAANASNAIYEALHAGVKPEDITQVIVLAK